MKKTFTFFTSILVFAITQSYAQISLTTGIYATSKSVASTYVELTGTTLKTNYAGKYPADYIKTSENNFKSESGSKTITILNNKSYRITDTEIGNSDVIELQLALPQLDKKDLQEVDLPEGKAFITTKLPFDAVGSYKYDGDQVLTTVLNADGNGKYQELTDSGAGTLYNIKWGILCNDRGQQLGDSLNGVHAFTLMIYTTKWKAVSLQYAIESGRVVINRDRFKDK